MAKIGFPSIHVFFKKIKTNKYFFFTFFDTLLLTSF
jgi:hypothetical protein